MHERKHVLLVTFPAYGHIIPLVEFGRKIREFHDVTLAVSAEIVDQMIQRELVSPDEAFNFYRIPDGFAANTVLDPTKSDSLHAMMNLVVPGIKKLAEEMPNLSPEHYEGRQPNRPVDVLIVDSFMTAEVAVSAEKGVPFYQFGAAAAGASMIFLAMDENWPVCENDPGASMMEEPKPGQPPQPIPEVFKMRMLAVNKAMQTMSGLIVNSVEELEKEAMPMLRNHPKMPKVPIYTVGPLISDDKQNFTQFAQTKQILSWMDGKDKESIVYVSFGSVAWPAGEQITELATALHALNKPFIFSLRQIYHEYLPEEIRSKIPEQFTNSDSKCLIVDWAPQKEILAHPSTSLFISHCGWNSTLESLAAGVPILAWPMFADQKINGRFLEKRGVAYLLEGTGMKAGKLIPADEIIAGVKKVVGEASESECQRNAKEWKRVIEQAQKPGGSSYENMQALLKFN